jgi:hypothetical protein
MAAVLLVALVLLPVTVVVPSVPTAAVMVENDCGVVAIAALATTPVRR